MTEERELKIPFGDLTRVSVACECGAEITIDINQNVLRKTFDWNKDQIKCPVCPRNFGDKLSQALFHFLNWYERAEASKQKPFFRLKG